MPRREPKRLHYAEYGSVEDLVSAIESVRDRTSWMDAYTPHPAGSVEKALRLPHSPVSLVCFAGGAVGAAFAYGLQYLLIGVNYPLDVAGFPLNSVPAFIPITFETTVLFASLSAFVGFLVLARLPRLWQRTFEVPGFESAAIDGFWLAVEPAANEHADRDLLARLGDHRPRRVVAAWDVP